jgi:hypothetical protein
MYIQCHIILSFIMQTKSEIINAERLFILMHSINFRKLNCGGGGGWRKAEGSLWAPDTLASACT